jgi:pyruvate/2-oxoglutarate dehydrogenase complex dihydrolipoamide acyltransferase (E2) component
MWRFGQASSVFVGLFCCVLAGRADAQEFCVACTEPNAVYRCVIEGAQPGGGQPLQMLCITAMAKQGGHGTCGIKRGTVFDCDGQVKRIPWSSLSPPAPGQPAAPGKQSALEPPPPAQAAEPKANPDEPPQTVLELAKRANENAAEQMRKANENAKSNAEAFAKATKKTWDCMTSFFTRCTAGD